MLSFRNSLVAVCVIVAAGVGVWRANAAFTQVTLVTTIDENNPAATSTPVGKDCPFGVPCKLQSVLSVADSNQVVDSLTSISTFAFQGALGTSIPNGTVVGNTRITGKYSDNGHCTDLIKPSIDKTADFLDGGLKGEVTDDPSQDALGDPTVWPTLLESDLRVAYLLSTGHQIVRRSVAVIVISLAPLPLPDIKMPINLLAFDVSDGNGFAGLTLKGVYNVAVGGDPTVTPTSAMCTPSTSSGLLLGQSAAGLTLNTCQWTGTQTMTSVLTHDASGTIVIDATARDTVTCSLAVGGMAEYPDVEPGPVASAHNSSGPSAAAVAGMAMGALLLAAGGWYARRRRLT
jgi:hypothetical protein